MPPLCAAGVPLRTSVTGSKVTPVGSASVGSSVIDGVGSPLAAIVVVPSAPVVKVAEPGLVKAAPSSIVRVNVCG